MSEQINCNVCLIQCFVYNYLRKLARKMFALGWKSTDEIG